MTAEPEELIVEVRLVGDVTGTVYAEEKIVAESIYVDPDLYLGFAHLSVPFHPIKEPGPGGGTKSGPELDPADKNLVVQMRTNSEETKIGSVDGDEHGHWRGVLIDWPEASVEIPSLALET